MATLLLAAAGSAVGGSIGGAVLGFSAAGIGQAVGAIAGGLLDQKLLGGGASAVETGRARSLRIQTGTEGAPIPQCFGRTRVAGTLIWSTKFLETVRKSSLGGKATSTTVREYSYSISFAVALCEGRIERIGRIWADGKLLDTQELSLRVYLGDDSQPPDPKIEAVEGAGAAPAYRGTAYLVFEDLPVGPFGNRIPQINVEVFRAVERRPTGPEAGEPLRGLVKAVALSPGTGEFALATEPVRYVFPEGGTQNANIHNPESRPDFLVGLDQLQSDLPDCGAVSLVVAWFGSDLRAGNCRIEPKVEARDRSASPAPWAVAGLDAATAPLVSRDGDGRPVFGGTPSDRSVIAAIREMKARGLKVMLYPFILMDIPEGNGLPDPYGRAEQPPFPWRGRITLSSAPGEPGSPDQTPDATAEIIALFGSASAADFTIGPAGVTYSGPEDWGLRRFALHLAALGAAAGGVEAICIGSEMRGLTTARSAKTTYPAVDQFRGLAAEVRTLLPDAQISYAADWSEYFGHQPNDGTGDRLFHLDPLWADTNIDFVGIDDYLPLSDWRHTLDNRDYTDGNKSIYSLSYLKSNIEGGEHYDWFYADEVARTAQDRTIIQDTAHGEDWVFRPKDMRNWWANAHYNRIDGIRQPTPTAWVPQSKPVWLTETGCPAVDLGANMPNLFFDPKSSESALPPGSTGARDDEIQRRFLQAKLSYWQDGTQNPVSSVYGGPMIPDGRVFVWTWDARPWPDFPMRKSIWSDGPVHRLGHWITGRVSAGSLAEVVHEIATRDGAVDVDVSRLFGTVWGYSIDRSGSAREALQPLMLAYGFDAFEADGRIVFAMRGLAQPERLSPDRLIESRDALGHAIRTRASVGEDSDAVRLAYLQEETDFRQVAAEARAPSTPAGRVSETSLPLVLPASKAQGAVDRWLAEAATARDRITFSLPPEWLGLEPADLVALPGPAGLETYRIERLTQGLGREADAVRVEPSIYLPTAQPDRSFETELPLVPGPLEALVLDLPVADGSAEDHAPFIALSADPWPGAVAIYRSVNGSFEFLAETRVPALTGHLLSPMPPAVPGLWQEVSVELRLPTGALASADRLSVLNGANALAIETAPAIWEICQLREAALIGRNRYRATGFLRGQRGTDAYAAGQIAVGARVVVLDAGVLRLPVPRTTRDRRETYRCVPANRSVSHPSAVEIEARSGWAGLRPFAPAHVTARRASDGSIEIRWVRRTRLGGDDWGPGEVPLGETREAYRLTIRQGDGPLRTVTIAEPAYRYTAAAQTSDGVAAGELRLCVAQLSDLYGYGPDQEITFDD